MTNYWEELDKQHFQLRNSYLSQFDRGEYLKAANRLYTRNLAAPPEAVILDMKPFTVNTQSSRSKMTMMQQAFQYCQKWEPLVEAATSLIRRDNLNNMKRL